jgi:predicted RNA-binding Zn-ribbon protein involved in translation (DUF1610 family)
MGTGRITKQDIGRLGQRNFRLELDCPNCGRVRIRMGGSRDMHRQSEADCPKCGVHIILDSLNLTLVNEAAERNCAQAAPAPVPASAGR